MSPDERNFERDLRSFGRVWDRLGRPRPMGPPPPPPPGVTPPPPRPPRPGPVPGPSALLQAASGKTIEKNAITQTLS